MQRRQFLRNTAWLAGGLIAQGFWPLQAAAAGNRKKISGRVLAGNRGLAGVVVSDGYSVVATNRQGHYRLKLHPDATAVFVSTPAGYAFPQQQGLARHYRLANSIEENRVDFVLAPLGRNDDEHRFLVWADPQVKNAKDVEKMMKTTVADVQQLVGAAPDALFHGITVGDIVWDELQLFADYDKAVGAMGIPFFQCLGNHDMDYRKGGDETSDDSFVQTYGPTCYSFNRGQVHYVVMDNVRYLGTNRDYDGYFQEHHLRWLQKDLSFVGPEKLIVLCVHIPVHATKNKEDLYALLQGRQVHIMSGHTHYHLNHLEHGVFEHNHGTVCGAWWTGAICTDGTPGGYGVYEVKGTELSWHYQATGLPANHQMRLYVEEVSATQKKLLANIWNWDPAWKTEYFVDGRASGALLPTEGYDPLAYATLLGPDKPKPRGFAEPHKTNHLFTALVPATATEVRVLATDRFGRQYSATQKLQEG